MEETSSPFKSRNPRESAQKVKLVVQKEIEMSRRRKKLKIDQQSNTDESSSDKDSNKKAKKKIQPKVGDNDPLDKSLDENEDHNLTEIQMSDTKSNDYETNGSVSSVDEYPSSCPMKSDEEDQELKESSMTSIPEHAKRMRKANISWSTCSSSCSSPDSESTVHTFDSPRGENVSSKAGIIFKVGEKLEACDVSGKWYPSKIVAIDDVNKDVLIHFERWSSRFDQWFPMGSGMLRAATDNKDGSNNSLGESEPSKSEFSLGDKVLARWSDSKKYPGVISNVFPDNSYTVSFYDGYRKKVKSKSIEPLPANYEGCWVPPVHTSKAIDEISSKEQIVKTTSVLPVARKAFTIEEDHNHYKCTVEDCGKTFRKEKSLFSHIKHYHPVLGKELSSKSEPHSRVASPSPSSTSHSLPNTSVASPLDPSYVDSEGDGLPPPVLHSVSEKPESDTSKSTVEGAKELLNLSLESSTSRSKKSRSSTSSKSKKSSNKKSVKKPLNIEDSSNDVKNESDTIRSEEPCASFCLVPFDTPNQVSSNVNRSLSKRTRKKILAQDCTNNNGDKQAGPESLNPNPEHTIPSKCEENQMDVEIRCESPNSETKRIKKRKKPLFEYEIETSHIESKFMRKETSRQLTDPLESPQITENLVFPSTSKDISNCPSSASAAKSIKRSARKKKTRSELTLETTEKRISKPKVVGKVSNLSPMDFYYVDPNPIPNTVLPFWDARTIADIHESDEVDELVHCICDLREESGLMVQCEFCLTWQHGMCFNIESELDVPEVYICFACKNPRLVRESCRYNYDLEWLKKGKLSCIPWSEGSDHDRDNNESVLDIDMIRSTNQLLNAVLEIVSIIHSLKFKITLYEKKNSDLSHWNKSWLGEKEPTNNNDFESLRANATDMIGDIFNYSRNILESVPSEQDMNNVPDDLKNELLEDTDLINFIASSYSEVNGTKERDKEEIKSGDIVQSELTESCTEKKVEEDQKTMLSESSEEKKLTEIKFNCDKVETNEEIELSKEEDDKNRCRANLLEHILDVQKKVTERLNLIERCARHIEYRMDIDGDSEISLRSDRSMFKDVIKGLYRDLDVVSKLAECSSFASSVELEIE